MKVIGIKQDIKVLIDKGDIKLMCVLKNVDIGNDKLREGIMQTFRAGLGDVEMDMLAFKQALEIKDPKSREIIVAMIGAMISKARAVGLNAKRDSIMRYEL